MEQCNKNCTYSDDRLCPLSYEGESTAVQMQTRMPQSYCPEEAEACLCAYADEPCTQEENCGGWAMVQIRAHAFDNLYCPKDALVRGTIFSVLDLPFKGRGVNCA